jgi:hypothetical protein
VELEAGTPVRARIAPGRDGRWARGRTNMKNRMAIVMVIALIIPQFLQAFDENAAKERVKEIKVWLPTFEYAWQYKVDSEEALEKVILFVENPLKYVSVVRGIDHKSLVRNKLLYETFLYETKRATDGMYFYSQLLSISRTMSKEKVSLMTFVLLDCCDALEGEAIAGLYARLFMANTRMFIKFLKGRSDWKQVVNEFGNFNADQTGTILNNLGDSEFEKEFKEYVFTKYPFIKEYMKKKDAFYATT